MSFVEKKISPLAKLLESHGERFLFQLPPRSEGLKLGAVLETMQTEKSSGSEGPLNWNPFQVLESRTIASRSRPWSRSFFVLQRSNMRRTG